MTPLPPTPPAAARAAVAGDSGPEGGQAGEAGRGPGAVRHGPAACAVAQGKGVRCSLRNRPVISCSGGSLGIRALNPPQLGRLHFAKFENAVHGLLLACRHQVCNPRPVARLPPSGAQSTACRLLATTCQLTRPQPVDRARGGC